MTRVRLFHTIAITLMVLGIVVGGVCWTLHGTVFWVMAGVSAALLIVGLVFATKATAMEARQKQESSQASRPDGRGRNVR